MNRLGRKGELQQLLNAYNKQKSGRNQNLLDKPSGYTPPPPDRCDRVAACECAVWTLKPN